jgi:hypothetical protein
MDLRHQTQLFSCIAGRATFALLLFVRFEGTGEPSQDRASLTQADSIQAWSAALRVLIDSLGPRRSDPYRIWLHADRERAGTSSGVRFVPLSQDAEREIQRSFPTARYSEKFDSLVLCSAGVQLRLPGSGCPIRDDGVIIQLWSLRVHFDSLSVHGVLIQSSPGRTRTVSWAQGISLVFVRAGGLWKLVKASGRWIT